jgi:hypothetical protein
MRVLRHGDDVTIGCSTLVFRNDDPAAGMQTEAASSVPAGVVRHLPDRLELAALAPRTAVGTDLNLPEGVTTYVGDIDLSVTPGSTCRVS